VLRGKREKASQGINQKIHRTCDVVRTENVKKEGPAVKTALMWMPGEGE